MNPLNIDSQAAPSPDVCRSSSATFASSEPHTNDAAPSGKAVPVGRSVLRYSTPRRSSSPFSSAYAAEPVNNGCHEAISSCVNPGAVRPSTVRIQPPATSSRSSTQTFQPARASNAAPASELMPAPTKTASWLAIAGERTTGGSALTCHGGVCERARMLLREVEYARPSTVDEAVALLSQNDGARALAGGQTIVNVMKARAAAPDVLVDLGRLDELKTIGFSADGMLELGAMVTTSEIVASSEVDVARPILAEVGATIADVQVRNRGTIGGNVCVNDPTNHFPPLLVALDATFTIRGVAGERTVSAD